METRQKSQFSIPKAVVLQANLLNVFTEDAIVDHIVKRFPFETFNINLKVVYYLLKNIDNLIQPLKYLSSVFRWEKGDILHDYAPPGIKVLIFEQ